MTPPNDRDDAFARRFRDAYAATPTATTRDHAGAGAAWRSEGRPERELLRPSFWFEPRTITLRPVTVLAAGIALVAVASLFAVRFRSAAPVAVTPGVAPGSAVAAASGPSEAVRFVLVAPASTVAVVGDFNGWDATATPMLRDAASGEWAVTVRLSTGWHAYAFVVDGKRWVADPSAPLAPADDYGERRSVVVVGEGA